MTEKLDNAVRLYLEGIRDGNMRTALDACTGDRYTQHSTGVADGKEGFIAFFTPFLERFPKRDIQVVRAIEDGPYVFCHVYQSLNDGAAQWVTADLFDTDAEHRIVEHWDVIQAFATSTVSGRSMVDGPTEIADLGKTEANKAIVQGFVDDVLLAGNAEKIADYVSSAQYHQHNPHVADGLDGFFAHLQAVSSEGSATEYVKVHRLIGQGNVVVVFSHVRVAGEDHAVFDIFRVEGAKIVEHWDVQEKIGPEATWNNSGKF